LMDDVLSLYDGNLQTYGIALDENASDCDSLASDAIEEYKGLSIDELKEWHNYYMNLISLVDLSVDKPFVRNYYNLLVNIVNRRMIVMQMSHSSDKTKFNDIYNEYIDGSCDDGYALLA